MLTVYCVHIVVCAFAYLSLPFSLMLVVVLALLIISKGLPPCMDKTKSHTRHMGGVGN